MMKRRAFLIRSLLGLSGGPLLAPLARADEPAANVFALGVASGDVTDSGAVLWTRLAPEPLAADGGMPPSPVAVTWELSADPAMSSILQSGEYLAVAELAHSVHVEVEDLEPGCVYWYRFRTGRHTSRVGRTRTLPAADSCPESIRFVTASCQNYTHGYFVAYDHIVRDRPDFVIHLGDYFYETAFGETFRRHETETPPATLAAFRRRHALYKSDEQLQHAHAELPFFTTIDNHDAVEDADPDRFAQRAAAYQAWYEHMPVRGYPGPGANRFDLHRRLRLGDLAQICLLDARQFRDPKEVCGNNDYPNYGFGNYRERCADVFEACRSMLGSRQEAWLADSLAGNRAAWNVLASPGPLQPFRYLHDGKDLRYIGAWDAYPANRDRLAEALLGAETGHPLVLSGDVHSFWAIDGTQTPNPDERIPLVEFVTSSISANWPEALAKPVSDNLPHNPQVVFYEPDRRGYLLHELGRDEWTTTCRALGDVRDAASTAFDRATFVVRRGEPGLVQRA